MRLKEKQEGKEGQKACRHADNRGKHMVEMKCYENIRLDEIIMDSEDHDWTAE